MVVSIDIISKVISIIISISIKPVFLSRGLVLPHWSISETSSPVTQKGSDGQKNPFQAFFISSTSISSHIFFDLPGLFCATTIWFAYFSNPACTAILIFTCSNHVQSTTSTSRMPSFERRVLDELTYFLPTDHEHRAVS